MHLDYRADGWADGKYLTLEVCINKDSGEDRRAAGLSGREAEGGSENGQSGTQSVPAGEPALTPQLLQVNFQRERRFY